MKNFKNIMVVVFAVVAAFVAGFTASNHQANKTIEAYDNYNAKCEILLDSIASWDESFGDGPAETDAYVDYLDAREKLDSIIWNK